MNRETFRKIGGDYCLERTVTQVNGAPLRIVANGHTHAECKAVADAAEEQWPAFKARRIADENRHRAAESAAVGGGSGAGLVSCSTKAPRQGSDKGPAPITAPTADLFGVMS